VLKNQKVKIKKTKSMAISESDKQKFREYLKEREKAKQSEATLDVVFADFLSPFTEDLIAKISQTNSFQELNLEQQLNLEVNIYFEFIEHIFEFLTDAIKDNPEAKQTIADLASEYDSVEELLNVFTGLSVAVPEIGEAIKLSFVKKYQELCEKFLLSVDLNLLYVLTK